MGLCYRRCACLEDVKFSQTRYVMAISNNIQMGEKKIFIIFLWLLLLRARAIRRTLKYNSF